MREFYKFNYDKLKPFKKNEKAPGAYSIEREQSEMDYLKKMTQNRDFDKKLYLEGIEFFNSGLSLEDASQEKRDNYSFVTGYNYAKRLAFVQEISSKKR